MAPAEQEPLQGDGPKQEVSRGQSFKKAIWDSEKKTFIGRTGSSWAKIGLFYLIYYACLTSMFAIFLTLFFTTVSDTKPSQTDMDSILKGNPGMGFRPRPSVKKTSIIFKSGDEPSYKDYIDDLNDYLDERYLKHGTADGLDNCKDMDKPDPEKGCDFDIKNLGSVCTRDKGYGFHDGKPCVLLKLNKIYGWVPETYDNETMKEAEEDGEPVPDGYVPGDVYVTCEGENDADVDNLGEVTYYPSVGFLGSYFPYTTQKNYEGPLVFAHFQNLKPGVIVQVSCKAWAANIDHDKNDRSGSVHLEVLRD